MPKLLTKYLIIVTLMLWLGGCSNEQPSFTIGVSACSTDNWREQMRQEMLQELQHYKEFDMEFKFADSDDSLQIEHINQFVNEGVDLIIIIPSRAELITEAVDRAYNSGVKVVIIDNNHSLESYTAFLGVDNVEIGRRAGEHLEMLVQDDADLIEITGRSYTTVAGDRREGLREVVDKSEKLRLVASADGAWEANRAEQVTDSLLRLYPSTKLIFAHNDEMAYGAYLSAKRLSLDQQIKIVGVDALAGDGNGIDLVTKGILEASFLYPTFGNIIMQRANQILHSLPYPRDTRFETAIINGVNAHIELLKIEQIKELDRRINSLNVDLTSHERTNELQRMLLIVVLSVVVVAIIVALIIIRLSIIKHRLNNQVKSQTSEISHQRDQLDELTRNLEEMTSMEELFLERFTQYVDENLSNPQLCIDDIADALHYSRSQLHRKVKALTGEAPVKLIRNARLERSKQFLSLGEKSISQIAYEVGFNSPSYFTKCFKEQYGVSPTTKFEINNN